MKKREIFGGATDQDHVTENFDGADLSGITVTGGKFVYCDFNKTKMSDCNLRGVRFEDGFFKNANFVLTDIKDSLFENCQFVCSDMTSSKFDGVEFINAGFDGCDLAFGWFTNIKFLETTFSACNVSNMNFHNSNLDGVKFVGCLGSNLWIKNIDILPRHVTYTANWLSIDNIRFRVAEWKTKGHQLYANSSDDGFWQKHGAWIMRVIRDYPANKPEEMGVK